MNKIKQKIQAGEIACSKGMSPTCTVMGTRDKFVSGRHICKECHRFKSLAYYETHKETLSKKSKDNYYIKKAKKMIVVDNDNDDEVQEMGEFLDELKDAIFPEK